MLTVIPALRSLTVIVFPDSSFIATSLPAKNLPSFSSAVLTVIISPSTDCITPETSSISAASAALTAASVVFPEFPPFSALADAGIIIIEPAITSAITFFISRFMLNLL